MSRFNEKSTFQLKFDWPLSSGLIDICSEILSFCSETMLCLRLFHFCFHKLQYSFTRRQNRPNSGSLFHNVWFLFRNSVRLFRNNVLFLDCDKTEQKGFRFSHCLNQMKPGVRHARNILRVCPTRRNSIVHHPPWRACPSHRPSARPACSLVGRDRHQISSAWDRRRPSTRNSTSRTDKTDLPPKHRHPTKES